MAFSDGGNSFWKADLTTRVGTNEAIGMAALACYAYLVVCGFIFFRLLRGVGMNAIPDYFTYPIVCSLIISALCGYRFSKGRGHYMGIAMLIVLLLAAIAPFIAAETFESAAIFVAIPILAVTSVMFVFVFNGIRASRTLASSPQFDDDDLDVFT